MTLFLLLATLLTQSLETKTIRFDTKAAQHIDLPQKTVGVLYDVCYDSKAKRLFLYSWREDGWHVAIIREGTVLNDWKLPEKSEPEGYPYLYKGLLRLHIAENFSTNSAPQTADLATLDFDKSMKRVQPNPFSFDAKNRTTPTNYKENLDRKTNEKLKTLLRGNNWKPANDPPSGAVEAWSPFQVNVGEPDRVVEWNRDFSVVLASKRFRYDCHVFVKSGKQYQSIDALALLNKTMNIKPKEELYVRAAVVKEKSLVFGVAVLSEERDEKEHWVVWMTVENGQLKFEKREPGYLAREIRRYK